MSKRKTDVSAQKRTLVGNVNQIVGLLIRCKKDRASVTHQLIHEGPEHKQILSSLLLKRLYTLVKSIEKSSGRTFQLQPGFELVSETENDYNLLPVAVPIHVSTGVVRKRIVTQISRAPEHELLAYAMALQVIEWAIQLPKQN